MNGRRVQCWMYRWMKWRISACTTSPCCVVADCVYSFVLPHIVLARGRVACCTTILLCASYNMHWTALTFQWAAFGYIELHQVAESTHSVCFDCAGSSQQPTHRLLNPRFRQSQLWRLSVKKKRTRSHHPRVLCSVVECKSGSGIL